MAFKNGAGKPQIVEVKKTVEIHRQDTPYETVWSGWAVMIRWRNGFERYERHRVDLAAPLRDTEGDRALDGDDPNDWLWQVEGMRDDVAGELDACWRAMRDMRIARRGGYDPFRGWRPVTSAERQAKIDKMIVEHRRRAKDWMHSQVASWFDSFGRLDAARLLRAVKKRVDANFRLHPNVKYRTVEVSTKRLYCGYDREGRSGIRGDISASYSADTIAMKSTVRKPFVFEGAEWISIGGVMATGSRTSKCYRLVPEDQFDEPTMTYRESTAYDSDRRFTYHGMKVKCGGKPCVLVGPPTIFIGTDEPAVGVAPVEDKRGQMLLFA